MLWCSVPELSLCIGLIMIILYGLFSLSIPGSPSSSNSIQRSFLRGKEASLLATQVLNLGTSLDRSASLNLVNLSLNDVYFFSRLWPLMVLLGYMVDFNPIDSHSGFFVTLTSASPTGMSPVAFPVLSPTGIGNSGIDLLLILLTVVIMQSFKSFESVLLLLLAFVGQLFMLHSCDLVTFYICLEAQNFCFLVLCALQPRAFKANMARGSRPLAGVEASIKYLLLSAFSSGVLLFWFSVLYLRTGMTTLSWGPLNHNAFQRSFSGAEATLLATQDLTSDSIMDVVPQMFILIALMFKLGGAPLHIWMIDIYGGVKRQLLMVLSTAPKLSLFGFWVSTWHSVWTDMTVLLFVVLSMVIGCIGAYNQPTLRAMFAYSTINEIGLMLMAIETAGFHSLFQHLAIYVITMVLLWNLTDKRFFSIIAVSLAGLPPLAGFFGKAWIFNSVANGSLAGPYLGVLAISLICTCLSLVYYLRVFRLFTMSSASSLTKIGVYPAGTESSTGTIYLMSSQARTYGTHYIGLHEKLTSFCVVFLIFSPLFFLKPFVL